MRTLPAPLTRVLLIQPRIEKKKFCSRKDAKAQRARTCFTVIRRASGIASLDAEN